MRTLLRRMRDTCPDGRPGRAAACAAAAGLAAQAGQAVGVREVLEVARGGEAVLGFALAAWLSGSALGAATWRGRPLPAAALVALLPLLLVSLLRALPVSSGGWAPLAALLCLPLAYAPGAFFGSMLRRAAARAAIVAEAAGACVAGALLTFVLLERVPALALVFVAGVVCVAAAATRRAERLLALLLLAAAPPLGILDGATLVSRASGIWAGSSVLRVEESPYGRLYWLGRGEQKALFVGGRLALTVPDEVEAEAFAAVVLAAYPNPRRVLVLGPAIGGVLRECLRHPVETVEVAFEDERILEVVDLPEADRAALARARVRIGDPRRIAAEEPRDVVIALSPAPLTLSSNRTYTREFFAALKLGPEGFVAIQLPAAPNEREGEVLARNVSVFRAMAPLEAVVLPGAHDVILAGPRAPDVDPGTLARRLAERGIELRHHAPDFFAEDLAPAHVARATAAYRDYPARPSPAVPFEVEPRRAAAPPPAPLPNEDLHPGAVLLSAAALAREAEVPLLGMAVRLARFAPALALPLALLGAVVASRRGRAAYGALSSATSGAASMGLWVVVLMAHQARAGALYGEIALLSGAFMAGFALGALRVAPLMLLDASFAAAAVVAWLLLPYATLALAIGVGALGGATLSSAAAAVPAGAPRLYAWDLLGAALAALVFGTFLVPALGVLGACATAAGLKLLSLAGGLAAR